MIPALRVVPNFPGDSNGKESACDVGDLDLILGSGRSPGEGNNLPTPIFLPGEFHGQRSLAGYSPWGLKETDTTVQLTFSLLTLNVILQDMLEARMA